MKVLVAVKRVVDPDVRVRVKTDDSAVDIDDVRMSMNPFDEIAVEEAVRLKERGLANEVVVVSAGRAECRETLRAALAVGADRAILIETSAELQPLSVAKLLKTVCERESPNLVLCGKQATDDDAAQTGPMLAALMGWPQAVFASEIGVSKAGPGELATWRATVTREVDDGVEVVAISLPAVITADLRLNAPRYATLPNILKARKKNIEILSPESLGGDLSPRLKTLNVFEPPSRKSGIRVKTAIELARLLKESGFA